MSDVSKRIDAIRRLEAEAQRTGRPLEEGLKHAVLGGLDRPLLSSALRFQVQPHDMGGLPGIDFDHISRLVQQLE